MNLLEKLQYPSSSLQLPMPEPLTSRVILNKIKERAIAKWGDKWMAKLATEYATIARSRGDEKATAVTRRAQLERAFDTGGCNLETAIMLTEAIGCRFQMAYIEIEEF